MKIGVLGHGHFADIVSVCLASKGHEVCQYDIEPHVIRVGQKTGVDEPGWQEMRSAFPLTDISLDNCDLLWSCYDVPLRENGSSDDSQVTRRLATILAEMRPGTVALLSSQWTVGNTRYLQRLFPHKHLIYVQENIRVGHGIEDFLNQSRIVVGMDGHFGESLAVEVLGLLRQFTNEIVWMSPTSAEMSKHALNTFLALQITFINEIARLCEIHGAVAADVSRALMTDARISPQAYLKPGGPFGGGSLQRDVLTLNALARQAAIATPVLDAIIPSNSVR